jgi:O-antigen ligase
MLQFILKRTVGGLFYYLGERTFSISTPGIAKFEIGGREFLRPYSIFPHPNVLAAFLSASILLLLFQNKKNALNWLSIFISIPVLFLSFSQNSLFALVVCLIIYYFKDKLDLQKLIYYIFPSLVLFSFLLPLSAYYMPHATNLQDSLLKRVELSNAAILMFKNSPMFGVGLGNFIVNLPEILLSNPHIFLSSTIWWLQPVHNIYLLVLSETGLIGFFIFSLLLKNLFKSSPRPDSYILLIFILLTGFLDHYWLTLQQSFLLLAIIFGLAIL